MILRAAALASFCALAAAPPCAAAPDGQRVFVTAHSFHAFVGPRLAPLADAAGIRGHQLAGVQSIGGSTVLQHWELPDEKNKAKAALMQGTVDVLTLSPKWVFPDEGIDRLAEFGLRYNPKLRVLVQESWIGWDDWEPPGKINANEDRDTLSLDVLRASNARFKAAIEGQIRELNRKLGRAAVTVVPVGDAVLKLRELVAAGKAPGISKPSELYTDAIGHGRAPIIALTVYCNFACIYRISPVGLEAPEPELEQLSPRLRPLLQQIAWDTVTAHPLSGIPPEPAKTR